MTRWLAISMACLAASPGCGGGAEHTDTSDSAARSDTISSWDTQADSISVQDGVPDSVGDTAAPLDSADPVDTHGLEDAADTLVDAVLDSTDAPSDSQDAASDSVDAADTLADSADTGPDASDTAGPDTLSPTDTTQDTVADTVADTLSPTDTAQDTVAADTVDVEVTPPCEDDDGDGRGPHCALGDDCAPDDRDVWAACGDCVDDDGDGYWAGCDQFTTRVGPDCDDDNATRYPLAPELPGNDVVEDCALGTIDLVPNDTTGIFVSASEGTADGDGTQANPVDDLAAAIALAEASGRVVFIASGRYTGSFQTDVSLFGGYDPTTWTRVADPAASTTLDNPDGTTVVRVTGAGVALSGLSVLAGTGANAPGYSRAIIVDSAAMRTTLTGLVVDGGSGLQSYGIRVAGRAVIARNHELRGGNARLISYAVYVDKGGYADVVDNPAIEGGAPTLGSGRSYGVLAHGGDVRVMRNIIHGGSGQSDAYAVQVDSGGHGVLINNVLRGGDAATVASCTLFVGSAGKVLALHNWIDGGDAPGPTRAVAVWSPGSRVTLINNLVDAGRSDTSSAALFVLAGGELLLDGTNLWGPQASHCLVEHDSGACVTGHAAFEACAWTGCVRVGRVSYVPHAVVDRAAGDFHLPAETALEGLGIDPAPYYQDGGVDRDVDGDPRPSGTGWEPGIDEAP